MAGEQSFLGNEGGTEGGHCAGKPAPEHRSSTGPEAEHVRPRKSVWL